MPSAIYPGEKIIDDSTPDSVIDFDLNMFGRGYQGMFRSSQSADELTVPLPSELIIPEGDWQGWIEESEERKTRVSDRMRQIGVRAKNQKTTPLCWAFATVMGLQIWRGLQNQEYVELSPGSVAGPITGWKYRGGWGEDALRYLIETGAVPSSMWDDTSVKKSLDTPETMAIRAKYRVPGWFNLRPRSRAEQISCLLRRMLVSTGLNYWGHQVLDIEAVWHNGEIGVRFLNSWGEDWPSSRAGGYSIRQGKKMLGDDMVVIREATAS